MNPRFCLLVLLLGGLPLAGLASTHVSVGVTIGRPAPVIIARPPPVRVAEARTLSPGPHLVWVDGHYSWRNQQWVWIPGAWVQVPRPGATWITPRWDAATQSWTEGYWEVVQPTTPPPAVAVAPAGTTIVITTPPPPPRREYRGHRPGRGYVWVDGYWTHRRGHHVWVPGYWVRPPRGHHHWVAPRWEHRHGSYVFIAGYWR